MADQKTKKASKKKTPTAAKREKQSKKRNMQHRSFKSRVRTAIRGFEVAFSEKDKEKMQLALATVYSLMDKGVKVGVYKKNKAARTKSTLTLRTEKIA